MKRIFDFSLALVGLLVASPILILVMAAIWLQDFRSPFYIAPRMARGGGMFRIVKFRSMVVNADKIGGISTASSDPRITPVGKFIRKYKIDELIQLCNVLIGDMSLVGPRPQVKTDADLYTQEERKMLTIRPGITDAASIVFSDEGEILKDVSDPDLLYNQVIRPWKSRLALLYIENSGILTDSKLILLTAIAIVSRPAALGALQGMLKAWGASDALRQVASRTQPLAPCEPPGATQVVMQLR